MADFTVTASAVIPTKGASTTVTKICGASAITQGKTVAINASDGTAILYIATTSPATSNGVCIGVSVSSASPGQPLVIDTADQTFTHGLATPTIGTPIFAAGDNAGAMCPAADLVATWFPTLMGYSISSTQMTLNPTNGPTAHA